MGISILIYGIAFCLHHFPLNLVGQEGTTNSPGGALSDELIALRESLSSIESRISELDLSDGQKSQVAEISKAVKTQLDGIQSNLKSIESYRQSLIPENSPKTDLEKQLESLTQLASTNKVSDPTLPDGLDPNDMEALDTFLTSLKSKETTMNSDLQVLEDLFQNESERPEAIEKELSSLNQSNNTSNENESTEPIEGMAEIQVLKDLVDLSENIKNKFRLSQDIKLKEELNSHAPRLEVIRLRRDIQNLQLVSLTKELENVNKALRDARTLEAALLKQQAEQAGQEGEDQLPIIKSYADQNKEYAESLAQLVSDLESNEEQIKLDEESLKETKASLESFQKEVEIGGAESILIEALLEALQNGQKTLQEGVQVEDTRKQLQKSRLKRYRYERLINENKDKGQTLESEVGVSIPEGDDSARDLNKLIELHQQQLDLLTRLESNERKISASLAKALSVKENYYSALKEMIKFINQHLIWVPTSKSIWRWFESVGGIQNEKDQFAKRVGEFGSQIQQRSILIDLIIYLILYGAVVTYLILKSKELKSVIEENAEKIKRISTDKFLYSVQVTAVCLLLPLRLTLIFFVVSLWLYLHFEAFSLGRGLAMGMLFAGCVIHWHNFIKWMSKAGSLFDSHFKWRDRFFENATKAFHWYVPFFALAGFILIVSEVSGDGFLREVVTAPTMIFVLLLSIVYFHVSIGPGGRDLKLFFEKTGLSWLERFFGFWKITGYLIPGALIILSILGYQYAAHYIGFLLIYTIVFLGLGFLVYFLGERWFFVKERRVALEKALEKRKAQNVQNQDENQKVMQSGIALDDIDEFDLSSVKGQTRGFLKSLFSLYTLFGIWLIWAGVFPALEFLEQVKLWSYSVLDGETSITKWISLFDILMMIAVIILTTTASRNIPGVIEIIFLERLPLQAGVRYAVTTVFQYAVVAGGVILIFNALGFQFEQFSWILAALSLGLGFGLQEVVANFVCGILLLLERPIRVGDVVTVSGTTGVVSKIRIRATTVMDWDRKEFIVPNKEFITGQILNWTLSNKLNRVVINIGVAYGSDMKKCFETIRTILDDHPDILKDPSPMITFDGFGDSSLSVTIRFFLANLDRRLGVTNEIHHRIHERFMDENIEIPFPQRDVHLYPQGTDPSATPPQT